MVQGIVLVFLAFGFLGSSSFAEVAPLTGSVAPLNQSSAPLSELTLAPIEAELPAGNAGMQKLMTLEPMYLETLDQQKKIRASTRSRIQSAE